MRRGIFTISIDHEYAWGYADHILSASDRDRIRRERLIVRRLLDLFERYRLPVTWAVVGHLYERNCRREGAIWHPEYPRPMHRGEERDWFTQHPSDGRCDYCWFDDLETIERIRNGPVEHELASHGYAHIIYGDSRLRSEAVDADIRNLRNVHEKIGELPTTFIFPRNCEGHHDKLREAGFCAYRGVTRRWYDVFGPVKRAFRLIDYLVPSAPTVTPSRHPSGMINVPDSLLLLGRNGLRGFIPPACMRRKIRRGIDGAVRRGAVFHLWFHPSNFSYETERQFAIFRDIAAYAAQLRDRGVLEVLTVGEIARRYAASCRDDSGSGK